MWFGSDNATVCTFAGLFMYPLCLIAALDCTWSPSTGSLMPAFHCPSIPFGLSFYNAPALYRWKQTEALGGLLYIKPFHKHRSSGHWGNREINPFLKRKVWRTHTHTHFEWIWLKLKKGDIIIRARDLANIKLSQNGKTI